MADKNDKTNDKKNDKTNDKKNDKTNDNQKSKFLNSMRTNIGKTVKNTYNEYNKVKPKNIYDVGKKKKKENIAVSFKYDTEARREKFTMKPSPGLLHTLRSHGNIIIDGVNNVDADLWTKKFNRWHWQYPHYALGQCREYLFFVKPDLHITQEYMGKGRAYLNPEIEKDPVFIDLIKSYPRITWELSMSADPEQCPFGILLTNAVCSRLDLPDITIGTTETSSNIRGMNMSYPTSAQKSDQGFDFSLQFTDNPEREVWKYFSTYAKYETLKHEGIISPPGLAEMNANKKNKTVYNKYIEYMRLHDQGGLFKFVVDDTEKIIYACYIPGVFPTSAPRNTFDDVNPGLLTHNVSFHGGCIIDDDPRIFAWFNLLSQFYKNKAYKHRKIKGDKYKYGNKPVEMYSKAYGELNGGWRDIAFVTRYKIKEKQTEKYEYYLEWFDFDD